MTQHVSRKQALNKSLAIAYIRVSTDLERQALGKEAQVHAIKEWARRTNVEVPEWFTEEISGGASLEKRPVLIRAIAEVAVRRAGFLVVQRLDRFSRDPLTAALAESELRRSGATLICADGNGSGDDPTAVLVRGILISVANFEKALIRSRITAALAVKKARGELTGKAPYGFRVGEDGKTLVPDRNESAIVDEVRRLRASGMSIRAVRKEASARGLLSRRGTPFTLAAIHRMLTRTRAHAHVLAEPEDESCMIKTMPTSVGTLTFSRRPNEALYTAFRNAPVDLWWNLAAELGDLVPAMRGCAREVLCAEVEDYSVPGNIELFLEQLERVCTILREGGRVHVSCYGGRGRTGMALACVRVILEEQSPQEALTVARDISGGPENVEQRAFVLDLTSRERTERR